MTSSGRNARMLSSGGAIIDMNFNNAATSTAGGAVGCHNTISVVNHYHGDKQDRPSKIAHWLRSPSINYRKIQEETRSIRAQDTIRWFFELKEYMDWVEGGSRESRHLKCIGMPGAGKTVLASAIIEDLERRFPPSISSSRSILYVYFKHDRQSIQTAPIILANLLSQIVQMQDPPSDSVEQFYKAYEADLTVIPGQDKIMAMLKSEIPANAAIYIVIDALDEFVRNDFSSGLALVRELENLDVRLLITSRYDFTFKCEPSLKVEVSAREADLTAFIEEQISRSPRLETLIERSPELKSEIITQIIAKSQGMFLITRFFMDWICSLLRLSQVRDALRSLPTGTDAMYKLTMCRVGDQRDGLKQLSMHALSWVLLAKEHLRAKELQNILAFELQEVDEMVNDDDLYEMEDIISACAGLITCIDEEVQFVHFSTREFVEKHCDVYFPDAKLRVMETCLRYLITLAPLVPGDLRDAYDPYKTATEYFLPFPFATYASSYWGLHASDVDSHERLNVDFVDRFFSHPLSPYLASKYSPYPRIKQTKEMSTLAYKTLFLSAFGLCSLLKRCIRGSAKIDLNVRDDEGWTPLFFAMAHNHSKAAQLLLNAGADANVADKHDHTCLHESADRGFIDIITILLRHGAFINAKDFRGESAIFHAVGRSGLEAFNLLYEKGADINVRNRRGWTLIHQAAYRGVSDIAAILLEKGMGINSLDEDGCTPIWMAADSGQGSEMVRWLIEKGADISIRNRYGETLLHRTAVGTPSGGSDDIMTALLEKGMDINSLDLYGFGDTTPIRSAIDRGRGEMARLLIEKGADISIGNRRGQTLLHLAASRGLSDIAIMLLEKGMGIDSIDKDGCTPIWAAVDRREWEMVRWLIEKGANISISNKSGQSLLHRAAFEGLSDIVTTLLDDYGFDVNQQDDEGCTPIFLAAKGGKPDVIQLLVEKGADSSTTNHNGETLLHSAAHKGRVDVIIALMHEPHIDIDTKDRSGRTALLTAIKHKSYSAAAVLIENGARTRGFAAKNISSEELNDFLRLAAYRGCTRAMELLMVMGADLGGTDDDGNDVIAYAAAGHALEALKLLLSRGIVDVDKLNDEQEAPINHAIEPWDTREEVPDSERAAVVRILLDQGADIHRRDQSGETPLLLAQECEWPEIRDLVEQHAIRLKSEAYIRDVNTGDRPMDEGGVGGALKRKPNRKPRRWWRRLLRYY